MTGNTTYYQLVENNQLMLDELKRQFNEDGIIYKLDLIHKIHPGWKSKWEIEREKELDVTYCYDCGRQFQDCICEDVT